MTWNSKAELAKYASKIAKERHPTGYNKQQLIEASEDVFGGFGRSQAYPSITPKIETLEDAHNMRNAMAFIDGNYPVGMPLCYAVGINGGCGGKCPVLSAGDCKEPQELNFTALVEDLGEDEALEIFRLYDCFWPIIWESKIDE